MQEMQALKVNSYLSAGEIANLLNNVEYILMASPSMMADELPIHFTIILNTADLIPEEVKPLILEKFCRELGITATSHVLSNRERIAFALTTQETPMPKHIVDDAEANTIPWTLLHIIDFLGDSEEFKEAKDGLSGWSYSYN
ncbi:hypothetical protein [Sulfuricurvum sp. RIFCSPLOWO2_12_FULL_43_24]|uniref:hypothetical protein n=1 Tax=Sulfuricurvum sp. RIFCSPLOWO2_12_FULL_43_24 TaxID=1802247 RepID=UPI0008D0231B|nr:hypothetical protein [Sulfuricurvum sp. RIFCSPLOWO2_12_FULL_43_24]OHD83151.1 MAG: hypothetical protein A3J39_10530 [Sulfuricurvum sp. RIFCSPHIGHO2_12_FULL_44_8]OHD84559.1 MAG: hypothetical protein A2Y52_07730 [Sulfuricurvum sp. RIFCSPLOWO2_02_43_6]OHD90183.1 MAG: hypothetical protein A3G19_09705 [Sulfuricurvum sp. RIFCSPLOWO2_12_FULL_43_24]